MPGRSVARRTLRARAAWLACLTLAWAGPRGSGEAPGHAATPAGAGDAWATYRPVAVRVDQGHARFRVPTPRPGSKTLVVVSSLATAPGPFPLELRARGVDPSDCRPPAAEPEAPRRPPSLTTSPLPPVAPPTAARPPASRTFHLMVNDGDVASASNYRAVRGVLRAAGKRVQVFVDEADLARVGPDLLADVVTAFDDRIFPAAAGSFGRAADVDGDGRFTVLVSGWLTRLAGGRHAVDGFVRGADFAPGLPAPFSNHCDMMYLSAALRPGPYLRTVLAHEYTHAVSFCARSLPRPGHPPVPEEEGWLDEALAHLVEDLHGFSRSNLDYRVSAFLSRPERYRLVVDDYYAADLFRSHGNRGATYLFLRWCVDQFGPGLVPALIASDRRGVTNLEAATGRTFADLFRSWSVGLFLSGLDPATGPAGGYRSLNVRGTLDGWLLAGPQTTRVTPDGPAVAWDAGGTTSRYLVVEASTRGAVEVEVTGPEAAEVQVTAVPLPDDLPSPSLAVEPSRTAEGNPAMRLTLNSWGGAVTLDGLAWEPLVPAPDKRTAPFRRAGLDSAGVGSACGSTLLNGPAGLVSRPLPIPVSPETGPIVVKAVGTDARGRRVAAWAEYDPSAPATVARRAVPAATSR